MPKFDDRRQQEQVALLHAREEEESAQMLAQKYGIGYVDLLRQGVSGDALRLIPEKAAREGHLAAFERSGRKLSVALKSPENAIAVQVLQRLRDDGHEVQLFMTSSASLARAWSRYGEFAASSDVRPGVLDISREAVAATLTAVRTLRDAQRIVSEMLGLDKTHRISSILETVVAGGLALSASDIHVEPEEGSVRLRYRLDGLLTDVVHFDRSTYELLLSRIKLMSGLKLNVRNEAQDGRFSIDVEGQAIEVRTSVLPGAYGESVVLRLLDPRTLGLSMEELGIDPSLFELLTREIERPNGMLLNTGPTGSGKTTTLYAFLKKIHTPDKKIITIEDPVEYHLKGILQTQVDNREYTFASGLRSALRQDPDIIMIGEIRDSEVATTAINAALTGHMVFSTLHTNTAAGAFPRLIDLGVSSRVMSSAITVVMAQRLVRKLVKETARPVPLAGARRELVARVLASLPAHIPAPKNPTETWEPAAAGDESGYRGRVGVFEAIAMDGAVEAAVVGDGSEHEIAKAALPQGHLTLAQDGILKVLHGETSFEELERVLDLSKL